jgi:hypothetical protein
VTRALRRDAGYGANKDQSYLESQFDVGTAPVFFIVRIRSKLLFADDAVFVL